MSHRKAKTTPKVFISDREMIKKRVLEITKKIADIVGCTLGPGGRTVLLESDLQGVSHRVSKDGTGVFSNLGAIDSIDHVIIETARDCAQRVGEGAGDGTSTTTILMYQLIKNIQEFCAANPRYSPQKAVRKIKKAVSEILVPYIRSRAIKIDETNTELLKEVGTISANGDAEMANKVYECFEMIGFGEGSHITIKEVPGPEGYEVSRIDGLAVYSGLEDLNRFSNVFVNDVGNQRAFLEKPLFILFDGMINDLIQITDILNQIGEKYSEGDQNFKNTVVVAHGFSDNVLTTLALNFVNNATMNIMPLKTPMRQFINSQTAFLYDLAAFTGAKVFGLKEPLIKATLNDLGAGMEYFESYRYRSTVVGDPEPMNVEVRAADLNKMIETSESKAEKIWLQERVALLTCGIAKFTIFAGSGADLKEKHDRVEDATMAMRSAIKHGCLPGGTRIAIDMAILLAQELPEGDPARDVLMESLLSLPKTLLDNAGHNPEEIAEVISKLIEHPELVYDVENDEYGSAETLGLFDSTKAVEESLLNAISIAGVLGTLGGIVVAPRDDEFERSEARADNEYMKAVNDPGQFKNEANERS
jgi:chaperonin GroEL